MKHVLILSCSTGEGHNSAAFAIEAILRSKGIACEVTDPVSFQSARMQHTVSALYNNLIKRNPGAFGAIYKLGDLYCNTNLPSPVYWANARYADVLKSYIVTKKFDVVICTHLYGMEAMTAIRSKDPAFSVPSYGILTDYTCIPFLEETNLNGYFVPNEEAREYLISKGIAEDRIVTSGIPVNEAFVHHPDKAAARKQLRLDQNQKLFLVMTGGIGCENMIGMCDALVKGLKEDGLVLVLTGKNKKLKRRLDEKYHNHPKLYTVSFTKQVPLFMAAADVLLSKPGGLSSTEAAVANVPLIHIHAIPGCETYNAHFFAEHGMSFLPNTEAEAVRYANLLAYDETAAENMRVMQRKYVNPEAGELIVRKVMEG